jgi:hypothetical protein
MGKGYIDGKMVVSTMVNTSMIKSMGWEHIPGQMGGSKTSVNYIMRYEGNWKDGKQHGKGKYILPDKSIRCGIWDDGKRLRWDDEE